MSIAITDDHAALAASVAGFLEQHRSRAAARALLDGAPDALPEFWAEAAALGWLGLAIPEAHGGSGFGLPEAVIVAEQLGAAIAPGPFVPTMIAGAVLSAAGSTEQRARHLPGLAAGTTVGAVATAGDVELRGATGAKTAHGNAGVVVSGGLADLLLVAAGADLAIIDASGAGVDITVPTNLDPTRPSARVQLDGARADVVPGGRRILIDLARVLFAAEATGIARACTDQAAAYAKERKQFGRVIATFQAVKHHCANMAVATELATAAVWDAARAAASDGDQLTYLAAVAASLAVTAAELDAQLNTQVHGGIGFTWEHDAHLYLRRASTLMSVVDPVVAATEVTDQARAGTTRDGHIELPPEAEPIRAEVQKFLAGLDGLDADARRDALIESGYAMPHWPKPWGRDASAVEQLVIEQEFTSAGVQRPQLGITGWVILTLIQHATDDQVTRWVRPALNQELIWCQLFSEPDAGSDAAGITTRGTRVDGGWLVNGQKVWTSGAHQAAFGLATIRTNPDVPKHEGITTMVIDLHAEGVEVRRLKMPTGDSEFNEVFFNDVFVPDDDVVGPVDAGWTVARATLGNESVSIGGGQGGMSIPGNLLIGAYDAHPERMADGPARIGRYIAQQQAMQLMNLRSAHRAVAGAEPGPEGAITKLVLSEIGHDSAAILHTLAGPEGAFLDGATDLSGRLVLLHRAMSIAGGTSEIKRNQIGERILGLPRDPLIN
ncbi:MAG TPA: acyl-CoA dehydrogenase [Acidimicrobiales bacterium]|jgi:alkylation response protein AidB-like acyl-CoA dehydrogenase|nr:acyl-CoA dehydrogenase [Acidimicrobiales bacterium]